MKKEACREQECLTTEYLIEAQQGNSDALSALAHRVHARLFRFCLWLTGNRAQAEDLYQDAFVKVMEHLHEIDTPTHFISWLYKVTKNQFLDYVRSAPHRKTVSIENIRPLEFTPPGQSELIYQLGYAFRQISAEQRYLFLLVYLEEHSYQEAGEILGISEDAVRLRLFKIRRVFRKDFFATESKLCLSPRRD